MRLFPFVLFGVLLAFSLSSCQEDHLEDKVLSDEEAWLNQLCSIEFTGRCVNTDGNRRAASIICDVMNEMGFFVEHQSFVMDDIQGNNLLTTIEGSTDTLLIIGAHYDGAHGSSDFVHYPAANDNASGVVTLLSLASEIKDHNFEPPHYTIRFAFWDAEESHKGNSRRGSRFYVNTLENKEKVKLYINLDCVGYKGDDYLWMGAYPSVKIEKYVRCLRNGLSSFDLDYDDTQTWDASSDCWSFKSHAIPTISITDCSLIRHQYPIHTSNDMVSNIDVKRLINIAKAVYYTVYE